jgi:hypothetical protein
VKTHEETAQLNVRLSSPDAFEVIESEAIIEEMSAAQLVRGWIKEKIDHIKELGMID